jgi:hypothetical protein
MKNLKSKLTDITTKILLAGILATSSGCNFNSKNPYFYEEYNGESYSAYNQGIFGKRLEIIKKDKTKVICYTSWGYTKSPFPYIAGVDRIEILKQNGEKEVFYDQDVLRVASKKILTTLDYIIKKQEQENLDLLK